jgi:flagellar motor switch protein FliM
MSANPENAGATKGEAAARAGEPAAGTSAAVISDEEASALLEKSGNAGVRVYDITAQKINRTQLPNLEYIAKTFAMRASSSLSRLLGRDASIKFDALDRGKCADLIAALANPASIALVNLKPLPGQALLSVDPTLLLALLDGFFGGSGRVSPDPLAAASTAAQRFLGVMLRSFAADVAAAWVPVAAVELEVLKQEHDARFLQFAPAQQEVIVVRFIVEFGSASGAFLWFLPESQIAPVREQLATDGSSKQAQSDEPWAPVISAGLQIAQIETRAILGQAQISLRELVQLAPGDVIPIDSPEHVVLMAEDVPLYNGRFGVSQGHNALKILNGVAS